MGGEESGGRDGGLRLVICLAKNCPDIDVGVWIVKTVTGLIDRGPDTRQTEAGGCVTENGHSYRSLTVKPSPLPPYPPPPTPQSPPFTTPSDYLTKIETELLMF